MKWLALLLICLVGPAYQAQAAGSKTITIARTYLTAVCAGLCDGHETQVSSDGEVRVRLFAYGSGRLRRERLYRVDAAHFSAFERILATIRPAGELRGHDCDDNHWSAREEVQWRGDDSSSRISGCFSSDVPRDNHIFCTETRAFLALGYDSLGLSPTRDPDPSALNGCEAEEFEASPPSDTIAPASGVTARTLSYSIWCYHRCKRYWFQIDSRGRGLFKGFGNTRVSGLATFAVTPAEFAAFDTALASYRAKGSQVFNQQWPECSPVPGTVPGLEISWSDHYDMPKDDLGLAVACDKAAGGRFRKMIDAPTLLPGLQALLGSDPPSEDLSDVASGAGPLS